MSLPPRRPIPSSIVQWVEEVAKLGPLEPWQQEILLRVSPYLEVLDQELNRLARTLEMSLQPPPTPSKPMWPWNPLPHRLRPMSEEEARLRLQRNLGISPRQLSSRPPQVRYPQPGHRRRLLKRLLRRRPSQ